MATVVKTWVFAADTEGLVDVGDDASLASNWAAADGNPVGDLEWQSSTSGTRTERARRAATGQTWETWGVPAGATVTDVQVTAWDYLTWALTNVSAMRLRFRVVGSGGATVHSAGELVDDTTLRTADGGIPHAGAAGSSRAVDGGSQASTTDVRFEVEFGFTGSNPSAVDFEQDNIALTITYTTGAAAPVGQRVLSFFDLRRLAIFKGVPIVLQQARPVAATGQSSALAAAVETDSAVVFGRTKALGVAGETDAALALGRLHTLVLTLAAETDAAQGFGRLKARAVGQALETDSARFLGDLKAVALALETDAAQGLGRTHARALASSLESDTAGSLGRLKTRAVAAALETSAALALGRVKTRLVGPGAETDSAIGVTRALSGLGQALETDTASVVGRKKSIAGALETDAAIGLGRLKARVLTLAAEADAAVGLGRQKVKAVGSAANANAAQALGRIKSRVLGQALETDPPRSSGVRVKRKTLLLAAETDAGVAIGRQKTKTILAAPETNAALSAGRRHSRLIGQGLETDTCVGFGTHLSFGVAVETDTAPAVYRRHGPGVATTSGAIGRAAAISTRGKTEARLILDGVTDYLRITDNASNRIETANAFGCEITVTFESVSNNVLPRLWEKNASYLCIMGNPGNSRYRQLGLEVVNTLGGVSEFWGNAASVVSVGGRYHIVVSFNGATGVCKMWINGVAMTVTTIGAWSGAIQSTVGQDLFIGRRHTDLLRNLQGEIEEFRLFTRALTDTDALNLWQGAAVSSLAVQLPIDEGTGSSAADTSGNGNTATITGAEWQITYPSIETTSGEAVTVRSSRAVTAAGASRPSGDTAVAERPDTSVLVRI